EVVRAEWVSLPGGIHVTGGPVAVQQALTHGAGQGHRVRPDPQRGPGGQGGHRRDKSSRPGLHATRMRGSIQTWITSTAKLTRATSTAAMVAPPPPTGEARASTDWTRSQPRPGQAKIGSTTTAPSTRKFSRRPAM